MNTILTYNKIYNTDYGTEIAQFNCNIEEYDPVIKGCGTDKWLGIC